MKFKCSQIPHNLLEVITIIDLEDMFRMVVHKGQAASLELLFKGEEFNEDEQGPCHILEFKFTGDMERQYFISQIIEFVDD